METTSSFVRDQIAAIHILAQVCAVGGLAGCAATAVVYAFAPLRFRRLPLARPLLLHALLIAPATLARLLSAVDANCSIAGSVIQVADVASTAWLAVMAVLAAAVAFMGYSRRKDVRRAEWRAFISVLVAAGAFLLPALLWPRRLGGGSEMFTRNLAWCWISPRYPEVRLISSLVPTLLVVVIVLGALLPTTWYIVSGRAAAAAEEAAYMASLSDNVERKLSVFRRPSTFNLSPSAISRTIPGSRGMLAPERFMLPFARGAIIYVVIMLLLVYIPAFLSRLYFTISASMTRQRRVVTVKGAGVTLEEEFNLGWSLVHVLSAPLAGFFNFLVFFLLAFMVEGTQPRDSRLHGSGSGTATPASVRNTAYSYGSGFATPLHGATFPHLPPSPGLPSDRQRRMSRKRSRMLSSTGMEDVWQEEAISEEGSKYSSTDTESEMPPRRTSSASRKSSKGLTLGARKPSNNFTNELPKSPRERPEGGRLVIGDLSTMTRRASHAKTASGRLMTWAERRRLLLEQQNVPISSLRNGPSLDRPPSPLSPTARKLGGGGGVRGSDDDDRLSRLSTVTADADELGDDPLSATAANEMHRQQRSSVDLARTDVFQP